MFDYDENYLADEILERKYQSVSTSEVSNQQDHLTVPRNKLLNEVLSKHKKIFDGQHGLYPDEKCQLELLPQSKPVFKRAYAIPFKRERLFKNELDALVKDGILKPCGPSQWDSPTFIVPKKDGKVGCVSDFRELYKLLVRKPYSLPKIQDVMNRRRKYKCFIKIDLSMFFY